VFGRAKEKTRLSRLVTFLIKFLVQTIDEDLIEAKEGRAEGISVRQPV
jgi:hypothetical protein